MGVVSIELGIEEISSKVLLATDNAAFTAFPVAAYKGYIDIFVKVWEWA
jgi:hypothetical protein